MRVLYAYYQNDTDGNNIGTAPAGSKLDTGSYTERDNPNNLLLDLESIRSASLHKVKESPGDDYFFINLASDMFNQGAGLAIYFKDSHMQLIGAMYLEDCYIQGHQMNIGSGSVLIMEGVSMQFDRAVPIRVTTNA